MSSQENQTNDSSQHLKVLSIVYYVFAGIMGLLSCIPFIHIFLGISALNNPEMFEGESNPEEASKMFGYLFTGIGSLVVLIGWTVTILTFLTGRFIGKQQRWLYCMVMSGILCLSFPFGTVLGITSLILLSKPQYKSLFEEKPHNANNKIIQK